MSVISWNCRGLGNPSAVPDLKYLVRHDVLFLSENLVSPASDHYAIVLSRNPVPRSQFHKRDFRYENAWQLEPGFKDVVTDSWDQRVDCSLIPRLNACAEDMTGWSRDHCRKLKIDIDIEECRRQLHNIRLNTSGEGQVQMVEIRKRMIRLLAQDDAYWR